MRINAHSAPSAERVEATTPVLGREAADVTIPISPVANDAINPAVRSLLLAEQEEDEADQAADDQAFRLRSRARIERIERRRQLLHPGVASPKKTKRVYRANEALRASISEEEIARFIGDRGRRT